ncbi:MAG: hypothetical protein PHR96_04055 [Clostridia bacterium]|nr:hypothetical protein [Clostridia bacterium]
MALININNEIVKGLASILFVSGVSIIIYIVILNKKGTKQKEVIKVRQIILNKEEKEKQIELARQKNKEKQQNDFNKMLNTKMDLSKNLKNNVIGYNIKKTFLKGIRYYDSSQYVDNGEVVLIIHNETKEFLLRMLMYIVAWIKLAI